MTNLAAQFDAEGAPISRRIFMRAGLAGVASVILSGCSEQADGELASAALGSNRVGFKDTVGWVAGNTATIAFIPFMLTDVQRQAVIAEQGVYPALSDRQPMVELQFELAADRQPDLPDIKVENLSAVQLTFWHFDNPAAVVRDEKRDWEPSADISLVGLSGEMRRGGWAVGTVRGQRVVNSRVGNQAYAWNLGFQLSLA